MINLLGLAVLQIHTPCALTSKGSCIPMTRQQLCKEAPGVIVDHKLNMNQCCRTVVKKANARLRYLPRITVCKTCE